MVKQRHNGDVTSWMREPKRSKLCGTKMVSASFNVAFFAAAVSLDPQITELSRDMISSVRPERKRTKTKL